MSTPPKNALAADVLGAGSVPTARGAAGLGRVARRALSILRCHREQPRASSASRQRPAHACPRPTGLETCTGLGRAGVTGVPLSPGWSRNHRMLWEAPSGSPFPGSAGRDLLPRDRLTWARSSNCCPRPSGGRGGAVGRFLGPDPRWHLGTPNPSAGREGLNGPESLSGVKRGGCEGWGCFPGLGGVAKSLLPPFLRSPSQQGPLGRCRSCGRIPAGRWQRGTEEWSSDSGSLKESHRPFCLGPAPPAPPCPPRTLPHGDKAGPGAGPGLRQRPACGNRLGVKLSSKIPIGDPLPPRPARNNLKPTKSER